MARQGLSSPFPRSESGRAGPKIKRKDEGQEADVRVLSSGLDNARRQISRVFAFDALLKEKDEEAIGVSEERSVERRDEVLGLPGMSETSICLSGLIGRFPERPSLRQQ
jgi:hypothetical protein